MHRIRSIPLVLILTALTSQTVLAATHPHDQAANLAQPQPPLERITPENANRLTRIGILPDSPLGPATTLAFNFPNGEILASGYRDGTVAIWNVDTQTQIGSAREHAARVNRVAFSPQVEDILASASNDTDALLWFASTDSLRLQDNPTLHSDYNYTDNAIAFSHSGKVLAIGRGNNTIVLWLVSTRHALLLIPPTSEPRFSVNDVAFENDGRLMAFGSTDGSFGYLNFSDTTDRVTASFVWTHFMVPPSPVSSTLFSPSDSGHLAIGTADGRVQIWDLTTRSPTFQDAFSSSSVSGIAFSPDGAVLIACSGDGELRAWDTSTTSVLYNEPILRPKTTACVFSPDGTRIAVATPEGVALFGVPASISPTPTSTTTAHPTITPAPSPTTPSTHSSPIPSATPTVQPTQPTPSTSEAVLSWLRTNATVAQCLYPLLFTVLVIIVLLMALRIWCVQRKLEDPRERRNPIEATLEVIDACKHEGLAPAFRKARKFLGFNPRAKPPPTQ